MCSSDNSQSPQRSGNWSKGGDTRTIPPPTPRGATAARTAIGFPLNGRAPAATGAIEPDSSSRGLQALEKKHDDLAKTVEMLLTVVENMDMELVGLRKTNRHQARQLAHLAAKNAVEENKLVKLTKVHVKHVAGCTDTFRMMSEKIVLAHEQAVEALTYSQKLDGGLERFVGELEDMVDHAGDKFHKLELGQTKTLKTLKTVEDAAARTTAKNEDLELEFGVLVELCRGEGVEASSCVSSSSAVGTISTPAGSDGTGFAGSSSAATMKTFPATRSAKLNRIGNNNTTTSSTAHQTRPTSSSTPTAISINNASSTSWSPASSPSCLPSAQSTSAGGDASGAGADGGGGSVAIVGGSVGGGGAVGVEGSAHEGVAGKAEMQ